MAVNAKVTSPFVLENSVNQYMRVQSEHGSHLILPSPNINALHKLMSAKTGDMVEVLPLSDKYAVLSHSGVQIGQPMNYLSEAVGKNDSLILYVGDKLTFPRLAINPNPAKPEKSYTQIATPGRQITVRYHTLAKLESIASGRQTNSVSNDDVLNFSGFVAKIGSGNVSDYAVWLPLSKLNLNKVLQGRYIVKAEDFLAEKKAYFNFNQAVSGFDIAGIRASLIAASSGVSNFAPVVPPKPAPPQQNVAASKPTPPPQLQVIPIAYTDGQRNVNTQIPYSANASYTMRKIINDLSRAPLSGSERGTLTNLVLHLD